MKGSKNHKNIVLVVLSIKNLFPKQISHFSYLPSVRPMLELPSSKTVLAPSSVDDKKH